MKVEACLATECDLLVLGSGAGGLAAAVTAAHQGLRVILAEKAPVVGGTTALSGGWIYAPRNPLAKRAGINEDIDLPRRYLEGVLGEHFDRERVEAFLVNAPLMVEFFETQTALRFEAGNAIPDTYGDIDGAGTGGRSVIAAPYDGHKLGDLIKILRHPLPETSFMGMTIQSGDDLRAFMTMTRSLPALLHVTKRFCSHLIDLVIHRRGMQLRNGLALVAQLLRSAADLGVDIKVNAAAEELLIEHGRVTGAVIATPEGRIRIKAARGVVLATGGFSQQPELRQRLFPGGREHLALAVPEATGDGLTMASAAGAQLDTSVASPAALCPVSHVNWPDGRSGTFPHIIDRGKPGIIGVLRHGRRFCNEGMGYHDYVTALMEATADDEVAESWLICDHRFQRTYGLGISRPFPVPVGKWARTGYLIKGRTIEELALKCGIDVAGLRETIENWNHDAIKGDDTQFHRGSTPYQRLQGDRDVHPNPCMAPIRKGPFYAVRVVPGSFGCFAGLPTNASAQVLGSDGEPIAGLYAAGTDASSVMGGFYPAGGINIGPALTFGFIAGNTAAQLHETIPGIQKAG